MNPPNELNPNRPADAVRKRKNLEDLPVQYCHNLKKYYFPENLKFNNFDIFKSLKYHIFTEKILPISLKLNFTPNTLGAVTG